MESSLSGDNSFVVWKVLVASAGSGVFLAIRGDKMLFSPSVTKTQTEKVAGGAESFKLSALCLMTKLAFSIGISLPVLSKSRS